MQTKYLIMSTKFNLNKFLQHPKLITPIDYSGIVVPDSSGVQQTVDNLDEWRKSQGYRTNEEKIEDVKQQLKDVDWNSEDATSIYETFASPKDLQTMELAKGIGISLATLPFTAGTTGGWLPGITSTVGGFGGSYLGAEGGNKLGQYLDKTYGTNLTPGLTFTGGLFGGVIGGGFGAKGGMWAADQHTINKAFKSGQLRYGEPTSYTGYHQSSNL